jgi:tellurite resistance protein
VIVITPVLLVADGLAPYAHRTATILIDLLIVMIVALGGWFTGFWMRGGTELDRLHPGYFLPTVAGGFVASASAAEVGQERLAQVTFGLGLSAP